MTIDSPAALWSPAVEDVRAKSVAHGVRAESMPERRLGQPVRFCLRMALPARKTRDIGRQQ